MSTNREFGQSATSSSSPSPSNTCSHRGRRGFDVPVQRISRERVHYRQAVPRHRRTGAPVRLSGRASASLRVRRNHRRDLDDVKIGVYCGHHRHARIVALLTDRRQRLVAGEAGIAVNRTTSTRSSFERAASPPNESHCERPLTGPRTRLQRWLVVDNEDCHCRPFAYLRRGVTQLKQF